MPGDLLLFSDDRMLDHDPGPFHPEHPGRLKAIRRALEENPVAGTAWRVPRLASRQEIEKIHTSAYVDHVENVTTGDRVRKGQALVHVYSPEINAAAAQLIANPGFDGARRRLQNLNVSEAVIDEMERTRKVPMAITWSSARDGIVLQRTAVEGEILDTAEFERDQHGASVVAQAGDAEDAGAGHERDIVVRRRLGLTVVPEECPDLLHAGHGTRRR